MSYLDDLEEEETLDGPAPVDTIAGPQTPREQVMQRISSIRSNSGDEDEDSVGAPSGAMEFARNSAMNAGIGRGLNALASATGYKPDNSAYDAMEKTGNTFASQEMNRAAQVKKAIQDRKAKEIMAKSAAEQRNADKKRIQANTDRNFALREQELILSREERGAKADEKRNDKELQLAVPGYERTGEVLPKVEEAQKFRDATAEADQLVSKLDRLKTLVTNNGSFELGGEAGQEMQSLATEIQLLSKGPNMYALGVLTGPDLKLLERITADPGSVGSFFTRDGTRQTQIDSQIKSLQDRLRSKSQSLGYRPKGEIKTNKPKTVIQNGVTYELNEQTGEYE